MDLGLDGRVALVTGGSSGLGYAVGHALSAEGTVVALNGRDPARLDRAVARLAAGGGRVSGFPADVSVASECQRLVTEVHRQLGGPDILFCNSGGPPPGPFDRHDEPAWQQALDTSLLSAVRLCRVAIPLMRERGWGRVVCLASVAARQPAHDLILSTTARAGLLGFAKALADEVAADGITVNVLCPGYFGTDRLRHLAEVRAGQQGRSADDVLAEMGRSTPARRIGTPEELAAVAAFLASEPARYVTGTVLSVDGGMTRAIG